MNPELRSQDSELRTQNPELRMMASLRSTDLIITAQ